MPDEIDIDDEEDAAREALEAKARARTLAPADPEP